MLLVGNSVAVLFLYSLAVAASQMLIETLRNKDGIEEDNVLDNAT